MLVTPRPGVNRENLLKTLQYRLLLAGLVGTATSTELPVQRVVNSQQLGLAGTRRTGNRFPHRDQGATGQIARWSAYGDYVVPDTSFYIHHKDKLEAVDFGSLINVWQSQSEVIALVPIVIVDELDGLR